MINSILKYIKIIVKSNISVLFLLSLLAILIFHPILSNGFMGDDSGQIVSNIYIKNIQNIPLFLRGGTFYIGGIEDRLLSDYYRPMMIIWYSIIYHFFGLNGFYLHFIQLLLHTLNGFLVYLLFLRLCKSKIIAIFLAILFLVHPIQTETVAHLANVQDLLFFFFGMSGFYLLLHKKNIYARLILMFLLYLGALLSKETAIVFFIVSIVYLEFFKIPTHIYKIFLLGCFVTLGTYVYLRCYIAHICTLGGGGHSVVPIARMTMFERMLQIPSMIFFYIKTLVFPKDLATYQYWIANIDASGFYIPLFMDLILIIVLIAIPFYFYFKKQNISPYSAKQWFNHDLTVGKTYAFFLLWLLVGITAYINILPLDATVAERWFYFPMVGALGITGVLILLIKKKKTIYMVLCIIILIISIRTYLRSTEWSDPYRLYSKDIKVSKNSASLENNYGAVLFDKGDYKNAEIHFRNAIRLAPQSSIYLSNLAQIYETRKDYKNAEKYYLLSIEYGRFYVAFERYAKLLLRQGRKKEAVRFLKEKALKTFPYNQEMKTLYNRL